jgi:hypothetical protein
MTEDPPSPEELADEITGPIKYLVTTNRGEFVIEIERNWKLTFGAVNPGGNPQGMHGRDLHCLRIWDGQNTKTAHLRAVFCDVRGFRDLSLPLARKVEKQTGAAEWTRDDLGNFETSSRREIESSWDHELTPSLNGEGEPF